MAAEANRAAAIAENNVLQKTISLAELVELENFREMMKSCADLYRIGVKIFDAENTILDGPETLARSLGHIRFEDVYFAYPDGHVALEGVDQEGRDLTVFDWAYQTIPDEPSLHRR